jgi:hypothetical protein
MLQNQSGEVEIDIEKLDDQALVNIRRYIYDKTNPRHHTKRTQMQKQQVAAQQNKRI